VHTSSSSTTLYGRRVDDGTTPWLSPNQSLLTRFDNDERYAAVFPGLRREELPNLVRHVDLLDQSGVVTFSRLSPSAVETVVRQQMEYFASLGQEFEWKAFAHDEPADLVDRLAALGFDIGEREAIMVLDLHAFDLPVVGSVAVRRVAGADDLRDVATVKERVSGSAWTITQLEFELRTAPDYLSVYVAYLDDEPAATAWIRFPQQSAFASLWGGSTLPEARTRGLYTALLATRVDEARRRGFPYVTVDARAMSRPILEKRGFRTLTYATPCTWHG